MRYHTFSIINCLEVVILVLRYWEATSRHGTCNMVVWTDTHTYEATRILSKSRYEPRLRATPRKRVVIYEPRALSSVIMNSSTVVHSNTDYSNHKWHIFIVDLFTIVPVNRYVYS